MTGTRQKDSNSGFSNPKAAFSPCQAAPCMTRGVTAGLGSLVCIFAPRGAVLSGRAGAGREDDSLVSLPFNTEA